MLNTTTYISDEELSTWKTQHGENAVIASIQASNYPLFRRLLDSGHDPNENDYLFSRDGKLPTLPLHIAAAHPDPVFLRTLIDLPSVDVDDDCQFNNPSFDNVFRAAVRASEWANLDVLLKAGAVGGSVDCSYYWEEWSKFHAASDNDYEVEVVLNEFVQSLFRSSWAELASGAIVLPEVELDRRRKGVFRFDTIVEAVDEMNDVQPLSNLEWIVSIQLPGLDDSRRVEVLRSLVEGGADISYYTSTSYQDAWDLRAAQLVSASHMTLRDTCLISPLEPLGRAYHTLITPLHTCVLTRNESLLRYLVKSARFNVDMPEFTARGASPLLLAIERMDMALARLLVDELGAQIEFITPLLRLTAVHFAASTRDIAMLRWTVECVKRAVNEEAARKIFAQRSLFGHTALHIACMPERDLLVRSCEVVRQSLHYELPEISSRNTNRLESSSSELVELLISIGAGDWHDQDHQGNTPGHYLAGSFRESEETTTSGLIQAAKTAAASITNEFGFTVDDLSKVED